MNGITNSPEHALIIASRLIDDRIETAQARALTLELRSARRARRRETAAAGTSASMRRPARSSWSSSVLGFLHLAR